MTDKRALLFPDPEFASDLIQGTTFWGQDGETRVRQRLSREALDDHFSDGGKPRREAAFEKHQNDIEGLMRWLYVFGRSETDRTVLIRTEDV